MGAHVNRSGSFKNIAATGLVTGVPGRLVGVIINSSTGGTLKLWDNNNAGSGAIIMNTTGTLVTASSINTFGLGYANGIYATVSGTLDCTFVFIPE